MKPIFTTIQVGARESLAVDTGFGPEQFARSGYARSVSEPGSVIGVDGCVSPWIPEGTVELDGRVFVCGPMFSGIPFLELADKDASSALRVVRAVAKAQVHCSGVPYPLPASLMIAPDGSILILPEKVVARALEASGGALEGSIRWRHSELRYEESLVFTLAALTYRTLSGALPYAAETSEFVAADMRDGNALPLRLALPGIEPHLADVIDRALGSVPGGQGRGKPTLGELEAALAHALESNPVRAVSDDERNRMAAERRRFEDRAAKTAQRKRFLRKHGTRILVAAVSVLIVGGVAWNIVSENAKRFTTKGLSPLQVAQTYYAAFNDLDTEKMQACVDSGTAKGDIDAATNLYVVFKVRSAYERDSSVLAASDWVASGSPATAKTVYGLTDVKITPAGNPEEFVVNYRFFAPGQKGETREDHLLLAQKKGRWKIERLNRRIL